MYESFFELDQRPFPAAPLTGRYFPGATIEAARQTLLRCLDRGEGAGLLIGAAGVGKTLLCYLLAEHFRPRFAAAMLFCGRLSTRRDLLQAILYELDLPYRGMEEGELRLSLIDFLTRGDRCPHGLLLLIDEAHALPLRLLEELRMITNLVRNGEPRVRLVLSGSSALEERFASPKLESFSQRMAARCYLEPLDRDETTAYVKSQLAAVSGNAERIFRPDAFEAVHRATDGVPRLINQLCDHALYLASEACCPVLDGRAVETAWASLQQLPAPRGVTSPVLAGLSGGGSQRHEGVVEFGSLEEEPFEPLHIIDDLIVSTDGIDPDYAEEPVSVLAFEANGDQRADRDELEPPAAGPQESQEIGLAEQQGEQASEGEPAAPPPEVETYESIPRYDFQSLLTGPEAPARDFSEFAAEEPEVELVFDDEPPCEPSSVEINSSRDEAAAAGSPLWPGLLSAAETQFLLEHHAPLVEQIASEPETEHEAVAIDSLPELTALPPLDEMPWQFAEADFVETAAAEASDSWQGPELHLAASESFDLSASLDRIEICIEPMPDVASPEGAAMIDEDAEEELVIDRYSAQQCRPAMQPQGGQLLAQEPVERRHADCSPEIGRRAEESLTLAEALVRHATAVEQVAASGGVQEFGSVFVSQEPGPCDMPGAWLSVDLMPAAGELLQCATSETVSPAMLEEPPTTLSCCDEVALPAESDLIVVEDDPPVVAVGKPQAAAPVRRQEYKSLFAKLRKN